MDFKRITPVLRIYSLEKAREFYVDFLGCKIDWEHRFTPESPVYMRVSRGEFAVHLSEHFGDGTPGSVVHVEMEGLEEFNRELLAKNYRHARPGILDQTWGMREMIIADPFNNRIVFAERKKG